MTYSIETILGIYEVEIQTKEVNSFDTEYNSKIRQENKIIATIMDLRQIDCGFVSNIYQTESEQFQFGMTNAFALALHRVAVKMHKGN